MESQPLDPVKKSALLKLVEEYGAKKQAEGEYSLKELSIMLGVGLHATQRIIDIKIASGGWGKRDRAVLKNNHLGVVYFEKVTK